MRPPLYEKAGTFPNRNVLQVIKMLFERDEDLRARHDKTRKQLAEYLHMSVELMGNALQLIGKPMSNA